MSSSRRAIIVPVLPDVAAWGATAAAAGIEVTLTCSTPVYDSDGHPAGFERHTEPGGTLARPPGHRLVRDDQRADEDEGDWG